MENTSGSTRLALKGLISLSFSLSPSFVFFRFCINVSSAFIYSGCSSCCIALSLSLSISYSCADSRKGCLVVFVCMSVLRCVVLCDQTQSLILTYIKCVRRMYVEEEKQRQTS